METTPKISALGLRFLWELVPVVPAVMVSTDTDPLASMAASRTPNLEDYRNSFVLSVAGLAYMHEEDAPAR